MVPLSIVERELRVASRKRSTYVMRWIVGFVAIVFCAWSLFTQRASAYGNGHYLFVNLSWLVFWAALSAGVFTTADCLSSERRNGTLGLLFLTSLRPLEVVLGKLAAKALTPIYGLVAVTPLLALPVLMGGVTVGQVLFVVLGLAITLFVSLSVGMLVSSVSTSEFEAMLGTVMGIASVCLLPRLAALIVALLLPGVSVAPDVSLDEFVTALSPYYVQMIAINGPSARYALAITMAYGLVIGMGVMCLWGAACIVRRSVRDGFGDLRDLSWKGWQFFRQRILARKGPPRSRRSVSERFAAYRRRMLEINPLFWLVNREPLRMHYVWSIVGAFAFIWLVGFLTARSVWLDLEITGYLTFLLNGVLKVLLAIEAPRQLAEDRKSGSLELILSTPLTEKELILGYEKAVHLQFMKPVIVVIVAELILLVAGFSTQARPSLVVASLIIGSGILLVADALALTAAGVSTGLRSKVPARAAWKSVFWVLIFPWVLVALLAVIWEAHSLVQRHYFHVYYGTRHVHKLWLLSFAVLLVYN